MPMFRCSLTAAVAAGTLLFAAGHAARAQDALAFATERFTAAPLADGRATLRVRLDALTPAGASYPALRNEPPLAQQARWFVIRATGIAENRDTVDGGPDGRTIDLVLTPGASVVGLDLRALELTLDAPRFRAFIAESLAPDEARAALAALPLEGPLTLAHQRSATLHVRAPDPDDPVPGDAAAALVKKTGQTGEIRALMDAGALALPSDLPLRVYVNGAKHAGARVLAVNAGGPAADVLADADGFTHVRLDRAGPWTFSSYHLRPPVPEPLRDREPHVAPDRWLLTSTTLTIHAGREARQ